MTYLLAGRYREAAAYRYNLPIFEAPPPTPSLCSLCATLWTHAAFYFSSFLSFFSIRFASLFAGRVRSIVVCKMKRIEGIFSFLFPFFLVFNESAIIDTQRAIGLKYYIFRRRISPFCLDSISKQRNSRESFQIVRSLRSAE